ncbi:MAG: GTP-binding protein [Candidatus Helarchaeota archaeon]|nr:GTP-binding protein [Candidatus Helarchaeota archaeon]
MINSIWIIKNSGQNLFYKNFNDTTSNIDKDLLSGFFVAIDNFANESGKGKIDSLILKDAKFIYMSLESIFIVLGCDPFEEIYGLRDIMADIGKLFLKKYGNLENWDGDLSKFRDFSYILDNEFKFEKSGIVRNSQLLNVENKIELKPKNKIAYKMVIIGNPGVGKTSLLKKFSNSEFDSQYIPTLGVDVKKHSYDLNSDINASFTAWDVSGQKTFRKLRKIYYPNTESFLIVYDVSNLNSFEEIESWVDEIKPYARKDSIFLLVGNKIDLNGEKVISPEEGKRKANEFGFEFFQTSAKTGKNVNNLFHFIGKKVVENNMLPKPN